MTRRMGRLACAMGLPALAAVCLLGPALHARQTATKAPARSHPPINVSEYRTRAVPPDPASPPGPVQPIPFSHKLHLSIGLQCSDCHQNRDPGLMMTFPPTAKCMGCHKTIAANTPPIEKLASYAKSGKPIPWVRVYVLLKGVNYSHRKHLDARIQCVTCHGPVPEMTVMHQATGITAMSVCLKCHMMNNAPTTCQTCHSWPKINAKGEPAVNP